MRLRRLVCVFLFKQKTAYEMRISDWSSDVCSSDLRRIFRVPRDPVGLILGIGFVNILERLVEAREVRWRLLDELVGRRGRDDLVNLVGACAEAALRGRLSEIVEQPRLTAVERCHAVLLVFLAALLDHRILGSTVTLSV